jgi:hypothetical protein
MTASASTAQVISTLALASAELGRTINCLEGMLDDRKVSAVDKSRIRIALPSLRSRRIELDADLVAFSAKAAAMQPPGQEVIQSLEDATAALANRVAEAREVQAILGAVMDLVGMVQKIGA